MKSKPTYQELEKENEILRQKLEISKSNEKFKSFFDNNKAIMLQINSATTQITKANKAAVNFYGYSENKLLQKTVSDLNTLPPDKISTVIKEIINSKSNFFEFQHKLSNGKIKDVEVYVSPFNIDDEIHMIATIYDITERKKTEQNLKRYKEIVNSASEHMSFIDTSYIYQAVNNVYLNAHNKTENQIIGYSITELFGDEIFNNSLKEKTDACFSGKTIKYQEWFDFKGIGKRYMNVSYYPYFEDNKIAGLIVVSNDITEQQKAEQATIKENARFKNIMDINPAGIYLADRHYNIEYINPVIEKEFGQINGRKCYSYLHDLTKPCEWCKNKEVFAGKSVRWEWFSEKNKKYYDLFDMPIKNQDGTISKFEIFFDITDRKQAEQALKESKEKFRVLFDNSPLGIYIAKSDGTIIEANQAVLKLLGSPNKEATKQINVLKYTPLKKNGYAKKFTECVNTGKITTIELLYKSKWNKITFLTSFIIPVKDNNNKVVNVFTLMEDITDRRKAEQALKESEEKLKKAQQIAKIGHWELDIINNKLIWSDEIFRIFDLKPQEFDATYEAFLENIHPDDRNKVNEAYTNSLKNKLSYEIEHRLLLKSGETKYVIEKCNTEYNKKGEPISSIGTILDITERKKVEQALKESNKTKDKFFSIISHDLRSPFTAILGFSQMLLKKHKIYDSQKREKTIKLINDSANSAFKLLENLLTWSRSQSGKMTYTPEKLPLKTLLIETMYELQASANQKKIQLIETISDNEVIFADKNMITTIFRNLISNAIKFTPKSGNITIVCEKQENSNFIEISVTDTGVGIPKDKIDDLFCIDKNTSTQGTENETGTGLGLILCKEFVEKHNGKIWIESEEGKGSRFHFTIPK